MKKAMIGLSFFAAIHCLGCSYEAADEGADAEDVGTSEQALLTCSQSTCNGKDPSKYTCSTDAYTQPGMSKYIKNAAGTTLGEVQMRYSPTCKVRWGRVVNYGVTDLSKVALRSSDGSVTYSPPAWATGTYVFTTMRYSATSLKVDGAIDCSGCDGAIGGYNWVIW